jgi:hypothetical protein
MTAVTVRWVVLRSQYPFGPPGELLGDVLAPDRSSAEREAIAAYGAPVVVRAVVSLEAGALGPQIPADADARLAKIRAAKARQQRRYSVRPTRRPAE